MTALVFLIRRLLGCLPSFLLLLTLTFFLLRVAPGGPFDSEKNWPQEIQKNIEQNYGLNLPLVQQYLKWITNALAGDLGESFQYLHQPVTTIIADAIGPSLQLGFYALIISLLFGVPLGVWSGAHGGKLSGFLSNLIAISGISLPNYLLATLLIVSFSLYLGWLPPALLEGPLSWILPIITLAVKPAAMITRMVRTSVSEVAYSDFVRTARAKGSTETRVFLIHILRNALIPVVTLLGPLTAHLLTGSFIVEVIFQIPGLGRHFVTSVLNRDYPLVMGLTLFYGGILITANTLVDLTYGLIDPRIRAP